MGGIYARLMRPVRTFNIGNRAERIISQEKPIPAPQYTSTEKQKKLADEIHPGFLEEHYQRNIRLDQRLKDVFVTSTDPQKITPETQSKLLPQNRYSIREFNFDFYEPTVIPEGKCTLKQAFTFISQHRNDPIKYTNENIATEYKIDKKVIDDILKHFKIYVSFVSDKSDTETPEPDALQNMFDKSYKPYQETLMQKKEKK